MRSKSLDPNENLIGQHFVKSKLVTPEQLAEALKRQGQTGERTGSVLLQLGYITIGKLLEFLNKFYNTPSINLFRTTLEASALNSISNEQMCHFQAIPIRHSQRYLHIAMVDPNDIDSINGLEFIIGKKLLPVAVPHSQMSSALEYLRRRGGHVSENISGENIELEMVASGSIVISRIDQLLVQLEKYNASDLLISAGIPPCLKVNNEVIRLPLPAMLPSDLEEIAKEMMTKEQWEVFNEKGVLDFGLLKHDIGRFRVNVYKQRSSISISVLGIAEKIPSLKTLGFSDFFDDYIYHSQGLILITGPTGHGKSTTVAAIIDAINSKRKCNIVTIEDPIEFFHKHKLCNINQREVGRDTPSYKDGLRHIFRQAPDIIVIGEMRDQESFEIAVQAAGAGHLVISTLHASNTTVAVERIINMFPQDKQDQIRSQLAEALLVCVGQRLVPNINGKGRVLAYEKLSTSHRVKNLIRENKCHQIRTLFQQSAEEYSSIDFYLAKLVKSGKITADDGLKYCDNVASFKSMAQGSARSSGQSAKG